jgi:hypothetical protein
LVCYVVVCGVEVSILLYWYSTRTKRC